MRQVPPPGSHPDCRAGPRTPQGSPRSWAAHQGADQQVVLCSPGSSKQAMSSPGQSLAPTAGLGPEEVRGGRAELPPWHSVLVGLDTDPGTVLKGSA